MEDIVMNDDNILLQEIAEKHGITVKQLATLTGLSTSAIYKYLGGLLTIPTIVWPVVYAKTRDQQILKLLAGDLPVVLVDLSTPEKDSTAATLADLIDQRRQTNHTEQLILEILADGKVDKKDRSRIIEYQQTLTETLARQYQLFHRINIAYLESVK